MNPRSRLLKFCLVVVSVIVVLVLFEVGIRIYHSVQRPPAPQVSNQKPTPLHIVKDTPYLYELNPEHDDISNQGTRDDEVAIPKPVGTFRVLVLGDSIAYGSQVPKNRTFSNQLETLLREKYPSAEVVNAGVSGYTAYNELQYYLAKGREFQADVVVVAFCMNDVVNPRTHWGDAAGVKIPDAAIPNLEYDRNHILPKMRQPAAPERTFDLLEYSELFKLVRDGVKSLTGRRAGIPEGGDRGIPKYITGEDTISIEVLTDRKSAEWQWLGSIYDQLNDAVTRDNARLLVTMFPLSYQLEVNYPYLPQDQMRDYCEERSIPLLDLLPSFRQRPKEDLFLLNQESYYDIWHLTEEGHRRTAEELMRFLQDKNLLAGR